MWVENVAEEYQCYSYGYCPMKKRNLVEDYFIYLEKARQGHVSNKYRGNLS